MISRMRMPSEQWHGRFEMPGKQYPYSFFGMVHAARRSEALKLAPAGTCDRLQALLVRLGLPIEIPKGDRKVQLAAIRVDKKKVGGKIDYVALRCIGRAETVKLTPAQILPARRSVGLRESRPRGGG